MNAPQKCWNMSVRQARYAAGIAAEKSALQAAREAGYSESYAKARGYALLHHPLVRSLLTDALEQQGVTPERIVQPINDALKATRSYVHEGVLIESQVPDHRIRLEAHDRAVALLGGIPKVGESVPTAHGLNLFITVSPN